jgi:hypothetical protein
MNRLALAARPSPVFRKSPRWRSSSKKMGARGLAPPGVDLSRERTSI